MFSKLFSPVQLKAYKKKCLSLREAESKHFRVKINFSRFRYATCFEEIIRVDKRYYLRNIRNNRDSLPVDINLIEQIRMLDGLICIEYLGSTKKAMS